MASSKLMAPTSPTNPDLPRQSSAHSFRTFGSINMDDLLKNIYADAEAFPPAVDGGGPDAATAGECLSLPPSNVGSKTVDEVWKEIVAGSGENNREPEMTLEDFLTKAGAVREEEVRNSAMLPPAPGFPVDSMMNSAQIQQSPRMQLSVNGAGGFGVEPVGFGNGIDGGMLAISTVGGGGGGGSCGGAGRGKRRAVEEPPLDKATQQKQRRMIKNRESAARSRERKQAYTIELESLATQLQEENSRLQKEEAEQKKKRCRQLMENLIPVVEKRRPPKLFKRVNSMQW